MTNLEIIKYLASNNPARLSELLEDIYCCAWNDGANDRFGDESSIPSFDKWLCEDPTKCGMYYHHELEQWSKAINPTPTIEAFYGSKSKVIDQAIDEIKLLENIIEATKHPDIDYVRFRKSVCDYCPDLNCMRSQVEICDCPKFENCKEK